MVDIDLSPPDNDAALRWLFLILKQKFSIEQEIQKFKLTESLSSSFLWSILISQAWNLCFSMRLWNLCRSKYWCWSAMIAKRSWRFSTKFSRLWKMQKFFVSLSGENFRIDSIFLLEVVVLIDRPFVLILALDPVSFCILRSFFDVAPNFSNCQEKKTKDKFNSFL